MKNVMIDFADWYINKKEGISAQYYKNFCNGDRDTFILTLSEYAVEFAIAHKYNPFLVNRSELEPFISKLETDIYSKNNSFAKYSAKINNHMPRAILGKENYIEYLKQLNR